jgi:hypothetical protein
VAAEAKAAHALPHAEGASLPGTCLSCARLHAHVNLFQMRYTNENHAAGTNLSGQDLQIRYNEKHSHANGL